MSGGTCREQSSTDASDSSMCGSNCASRPERASSSVERSHEERVTFRWRRFLSRSHSFYSSVMSDDSGRNSREETTGSAGDKKSTPLSESGTTSCGNKRKAPQPETFTHSDPSDHRSRFGSVQTTTNGRLGDADLGLSASYRTGSVSRECVPGMDDVVCHVEHVGVERRDRTTFKLGLITEQPQSTPPCPGCASTTRLQPVTNKTETFFGCSRFPLCIRVVHTSHTMESRQSSFVDEQLAQIPRLFRRSRC